MLVADNQAGVEPAPSARGARGEEAAGHGNTIAALRQRLNQLSIAVEQSPVAIAITNTSGQIEYVNQRFLDVTGYGREELLGKTPAVIQSGETSSAVYRDLWETLKAGEVWRGEIRNRRKSGECYLEAEVITPVRDDQGSVISFVAIKEDITERRRQERELELLATVFQTGQATMITDAEMRIERANQAFTDITGYREEEVVGKTPKIFKSGRHGKAFYRRLWQSLLDTAHWQGEIWNRNKFGEVYPLWQSITAVHDDQGEIRHFVAVFHNITERKRMEDELERQATRDHLTGAFNRRAFDATLCHALEQAERDQAPFSLLLFDIDHFKQVNDRHGHDVGDAILKRLAERVARTLRATDILCRWGGEEFTILLQDTPLKGAASFAERLRQRVAEARLNGLAVTISTGIAEYRPGDDTGSMLARADDALYRAKQAGRNCIRVESE
ncbi:MULTISPECIES: diguanylate cyclase [unclassified Halomonas]|uniref:sensor domain-containing diguanylate cyclase n=1 Tax=unclassified Halomonas TaxID=2609666 RepID=UPI0028856752|nr:MULTISPECIES: diguanylate cyclase [unclassified Halomonas]MDT0500495.1 diguanylate cyclase [Halomonas sp. PAR7]MDT0511609.1 diguanylate cyclase [Halomonas sp. LES1]MDT0590103.1 diguanylate cyclase [Halomonas sp. PAR8]